MVTDTFITGPGHDEKQQILQQSPRPRPRANGANHNETPHNEEEFSEEGEKGDEMAFCMMLMRKKVHYFPVFTWVFIITSFFICYGIAVLHHHVEPDFPYISYTAIQSPERCYFAQLVNFGACLLAGNVFLRYLQMKEVLSWHGPPDPAHRRLNIATLIIGFLSALGFSMVANFQTIVMRPLHYTGAGLAFVFGLCYCWMSSALTWKKRRQMNNTCVAIFQLLNSAVLTIFLVIFGVSKGIYKYRENHNMGTKWDKLRTVYLLSTSTEWLTATLIVTFVLTLYSDFKKIRFYGPRVRYMDGFGPRRGNQNCPSVNGRPTIAMDAIDQNGQHVENMADVRWLPLYFSNCQNMHRKSKEKANHLRTEGNKYFKTQNYEKALELYTECIQHAPTPGCQEDVLLALGLGNRSAALFNLKKYEECLKDISFSLDSGYPLENRHKLLVRRTYCLLHLGHIQEAEQALQVLKKYVSENTTETTKTDNFKTVVTKLERSLRENRSRSSKMKDKDEKVSVPEVVYGASDRITQASSALVMERDEIRGRHLITRKSLKAGDTLIVEEPFAAVLLPDHYKTHCHHCFNKLSLAPVPCTECSMVWYCSQTCRDESWSIYHSVECSYQDLSFSVGIAHLSLRIILTAGYHYLTDFLSGSRPPGSEGVYGSGYEPVFDLLTHEEDMETEDLFQYTLTASLLLQVLLLAGCIPASSNDLSPGIQGVGSLLLRHILQLVCNAHAITELQVTEPISNQIVDTKSQVRVATAIYPTASLMNHSCDPTIISSFQGSVLVVRAIKDVKPGEEIFNCYGPHYRRMARDERQQVLSSQYFFHCICTACEEDKNVAQCPLCGQATVSSDWICSSCKDKGNSETIARELEEADQAFKHGLEKLQDMNITDATTCFCKCVKIRARTVYRHHKSLCIARDCLAKCYAMTGEFGKAAEYLEDNMPSVENMFGQSSIEVGYELQKLAEVLFNDRQVKKALTVIERAIDIFTVQFGEHSKDKNLTELREMRDCLLRYGHAMDHHVS